MTATFTAYNDKSSAKRGFARKFKDLDPSSVESYLDKVDGKWGFSSDDKGPVLTNIPPASTVQPLGEAQTEAAQRAAAFEVPADAKRDADLEAALEQHDEQGEDKPSALGAFAFAQLAGGHTAQPAPAAVRSAPVMKEKDRPEANGVKRPSSGSICSKIWDLSSSMSVLSESGDAHTKVAKLGDVIKAAEARGINKFTARTQYARWRVFHGITGRA